MHDGAVVQMGTPQELFETPGAHLRRLFHRLAGDERPRRARIEGDRARRRRGRSSRSPPTMGRPVGAHADRHPAGVRAADRWRGRLPVTIRRVEDVGRHRIVRAELFGQRLDVIVDEGAALPAADATRVAFEPDKHQRLRRRLARRGERWLMEQDPQRPRLVPRPADAGHRRLLGGDPADDGGQLLGQDTFGKNDFFWAGLDWFDEMLHSDRLWAALGPADAVLRRSSSRSRCRSASSSRSTCRRRASGPRSASC